MESTDGGLLLVISDFTYEDESDPSEVAALWCYAGPHLLITARLHALKSSDELRQRMRTGINATSGIELAAQLLDIRTARIKQLVGNMTRQLGREFVLARAAADPGERWGHTRAPVLAALAVNRYPRSTSLEAERTS